MPRIGAQAFCRRSLNTKLLGDQTDERQRAGLAFLEAQNREYCVSGEDDTSLEV